MAKRKARTDAERKTRQCERLARVLRVLHSISGQARWDAEALSKELEVSVRSIHRDLQILTFAGVPWYFCERQKCYRVLSGFKLPGLETPAEDAYPTASMIVAAAKLENDMRRFLETLHEFNEALAGKPGKEQTK